MKTVLVAVKENNLERFLESTGTTGRKNFKIPVSAFSMFPDSVAASLKTLKKTSSTFGGTAGKKV